MLLKQVFKTLAGAQKRAAFEQAHPPHGQPQLYVYRVVKATSGDGWQIAKVRK